MSIIYFIFKIHISAICLRQFFSNRRLPTPHKLIMSCDHAQRTTNRNFRQSVVCPGYFSVEKKIIYQSKFMNLIVNTEIMNELWPFMDTPQFSKWFTAATDFSSASFRLHSLHIMYERLPPRRPLYSSISSFLLLCQHL